MENFKIKSEVRLEADILYSAAYREIMTSGATITILMRCYQKRKWDTPKKGNKQKPIYRNEPFILPYKEIKALCGVGNTQCWKIINRLVDVGFLDVEHQGGWYQKHERENDYSRYVLSDRWRKYGTPEFVEKAKEKKLPGHFHVRENIARKLKSTSLKRSRHVHNSEVDRPKTAKCRVHESEVDRTGTKAPESLAAFA